MSFNKALAHATRVSFGEVSAQWIADDGSGENSGAGWSAFDARGRRQGARLIVEGLTFSDAVERAYALSLREPTK